MEDDPIETMSEAFDFAAAPLRYMRDAFSRDCQDGDTFMQDMVVLEIMQKRRRYAFCCGSEEDRAS